jgi:hypothetical protein
MYLQIGGKSAELYRDNLCVKVSNNFLSALCDKI